MEPVRLWKVLTPPVFSYYLNCILKGTLENTKDVWRIIRSDFAVLSLIGFLSATRDFVTCNKASDPNALDPVTIDKYLSRGFSIVN